MAEFIYDGISSRLRGIEILTTRFIGLIHVIKTGRWDFLEGIQSSVATTDALPLSAKQMAKIIKQGATITAVSTPVVKSTRIYNDNNRLYGERNVNGTAGTSSGNFQRTGKKKDVGEKSTISGTTGNSGSKPT